MSDRKKKMAAALAAVNLYLQQEEALAVELSEQEAKQAKMDFSAWAHSGRQEMMTLRRMVQIRAFTRF